MMNELTRQQTSRRGFGAAFLAAMHDWRQRQAAREINIINISSTNRAFTRAGLMLAAAAQPAHPQPASRP